MAAAAVLNVCDWDEKKLAPTWLMVRDRGIPASATTPPANVRKEAITLSSAALEMEPLHCTPAVHSAA
jgi:hypothetical protein